MIMWYVILVVCIVLLLFSLYVCRLLTDVRCPKCGRVMKNEYDRERDCEVYRCECGHKMYICG
jgi:hypothetical protein